MKCPECKGGGFYVGLVTREPCKVCGGSGSATLSTEQVMKDLGWDFEKWKMIPTNETYAASRAKALENGEPWPGQSEALKFKALDYTVESVMGDIAYVTINYEFTAKELD